MNYRICLVCFLACIAGFLHAENERITFYLASGSTISCPINEKLVIKVADDRYTIESKTYTFCDITKYVFEQGANVPGIAHDSDAKIEAYPNPTAGLLTVSNCGSSVAVYSVSGAATEAAVTICGDSATIDLSPLPSGTYILKTNNESIKILKR